MRSPRFQKSDVLQIARIFNINMDHSGDVHQGIVDKYLVDVLNEPCIVKDIEDRHYEDEVGESLYVYSVTGIRKDFNLWFHEGELDFYAGKTIKIPNR